MQTHSPLKLKGLSIYFFSRLKTKCFKACLYQMLEIWWPNQWCLSYGCGGQLCGAMAQPSGMVFEKPCIFREKLEDHTGWVEGGLCCVAGSNQNWKRVTGKVCGGWLQVRVEEPAFGSQEFISVKAITDLKSLCGRSPWKGGKKRNKGTWVSCFTSPCRSHKPGE